MKDIKRGGRRKREALFPSWLPAHRLEDGGDGIFIVFVMGFPQMLERKIEKHFEKYFEVVQWCPEPESHGEDAWAVLNCFYPKF